VTVLALANVDPAERHAVAVHVVHPISTNRCISRSRENAFASSPNGSAARAGILLSAALLAFGHRMTDMASWIAQFSDGMSTLKREPVNT
jgi:hypothetical protein